MTSVRARTLSREYAVARRVRGSRRGCSCPRRSRPRLLALLAMDADRPRRSHRTRAALKDCGDVADPPCSDSRPRRASPEGPRSPAPASCVNAKLTRSCRARANHPRLGRRRTRMTGRFRRWPGSAIHTIRDSLRTAPPRWSPAVASGCRSHASGVPRRASSSECRRPSIGSLEDVQSRFAWIENRTYL